MEGEFKMHQTPLDLNNLRKSLKVTSNWSDLARAQTAQESDAEDIFQEVFMRLIKSTGPGSTMKNI